MIDDELSWLDNFVPTKRDDLKELDNTVLAGHLKLIQTLLACEGVDKVTIGMTIFYWVYIILEALNLNYNF